MRRILLSAIAVVGFSGFAEAGPLTRFVTQTHRVTQGQVVGRRMPEPAHATSSASGGLAHSKSVTQAQTGRMAHVGTVPPGHYEGVGYSTISPQHALEMCCYSQSGLPIVDQAVVRGANGWYATRIYAAR